jgi:predicted CXXCH cytochrome family protein
MKSKAPPKYGRRTSASEGPGAFTTGFLAALLLILPVVTDAAAATGQKENPIAFVFPWPGSIIAEGPVIIAGTLPEGDGDVLFLLNGRPVEGFLRKGRTFSGNITPPRGFNEIQVRLGEQRAIFSFHYGVKGGGREPFAYHQPTTEAECAACHSKSAQENTFTEAAICYGCHTAKAVMFPFVHGPVAAGRCLICHEPHGSNIPGLTRLPPQALCTQCHDQPSTEEHSVTRSRVCTLCHNPHYGSTKAMLKGFSR